MNLRDYKTVKERRGALGALPHIGTFSLDEEVASTRNCENMIGVAQVPLGIAGPLLVHSSQLTVHSYYIPLATTEGALVASVNRGCKAITESGGATVDSYKVGATRGPVFKVSSLHESEKLRQFLYANQEEFNRVCQTTSSHLKLSGLVTKGVGRYRYVRFYFDTQDAMGMNMVTIATAKIVAYIEEKLGFVCISVAGNFDTDKKPSWLNFIDNRGIPVWAEVTIPQHVLQNTLKTTSKKMFDVWLSKCMLGSVVSGSMGFNAHYANVLAAFFIATGQDPAHVAECSVGITTTEVMGEDLYVSIYLPDLMVGIVGGGTGLATQKEALGIIGAKTSAEFAEVVGAAVLAGEISLLASLSEGSLVKAHQRLGRGK